MPPHKGQPIRYGFTQWVDDWNEKDQWQQQQQLMLQGQQQQQLSNNNNNDTAATTTGLFGRLRGCIFWPWGLPIEEHQQLYLADRCDCFNCIIGWPVKHGVRHPIYDYEKIVFDKLMEEKKASGPDDYTHKHLWVKKATGLGITEFVLRFMVWLASRNNELAGSTMCIVTGPNEALAQDLVQRVRMLFSEFPDVRFEVSSAKRIKINDVMFEAYPSNHLESARGIPDVSVFFLDEAAFFGSNAQEKENPRTISERYIGKSNPYLIQCSTPNLADDNFGSIEFEENPIYKRVFLHYSVGLGKIYTEEEIEGAKATPSFRREYELEYLGAFGNTFKPESISLAEKIGAEVNTGEIRQDTRKSMGVDAGFSSSAFGIVITQHNPKNGKIEVLYAEEFERPDFNAMIDHIIKLKYNYVVEKVFVDAANVPVITSLKKILNERTDYHEELLKIKHKHPPEPARYMDIVPVAFNPEGKDMLIATYMMLDKGWLAIHPKFAKLLTSLRTATSREGALDKGATVHDDVLDALRLSLRFYNLPE